MPHKGDAQAAQNACVLAQAKHVLQLRAFARLDRARTLQASQRSACSVRAQCLPWRSICCSCSPARGCRTHASIRTDVACGIEMVTSAGPLLHIRRTSMCMQELCTPRATHTCIAAHKADKQAPSRGSKETDGGR